MGSFIRRRRPRANELGLQFTKGKGGVEAALFAPCGDGVPLRLHGMPPEWAIRTARDLAGELGLDVAVMDEAGVWDDVGLLANSLSGCEHTAEGGRGGSGMGMHADQCGSVRFGKA